MKRTLSIVLALVMLLAMFTMVGAAQSPEAQQAEAAETGQTAPEVPAEPEAVPSAPVAAPAEPEAAPAASEAPVEPAADEPEADEADTTEPETASEPEPVSEANWVELDCNGGSHLGYTKFYADVFDGKLHSTLAPVRDGYDFAGWYTTQDNANNLTGKAIHNGDEVESGKTLYAGWKESPKPEDTTDNYRYGVWLHVVNGNFTGTYTVKGKPGQDITNEPSVWVEFQDVNARTLPSVGLPQVTRSNGEFKGWYTAAPTEELVSENGYRYWRSTSYNGQEVKAGQSVPAGVQVLYAAFSNKETLDEGAKLVTFKLNWNGMFGKTAAMTCTRSYGSQFTAKDAAVLGMNYVYDDPNAPKEAAITWASLAKYWADAEFDGYKFLGWSETWNGTINGTIIDKDTPITDGMTFYAQWKKGESGPTEPKTESVGDVDHIHIEARNMTIRMDPTKTNSVTVTAFVTPVGATNEITWNVKVPKTIGSGNLADAFKESKPQEYTIKSGTISPKSSTTEEAKFTAEAKGLNLVITPQPGCSQVLYVSAECNGHEAPTPVTVVIAHTPNSAETVTQAATCTAAGEAAILCTECGEATEVRAIPATGHSYEVVSSQVVSGVRVYTEQCTAGDAEKQIKAGDANDDGYVSLRDVSMLYNSVKGSPNAEVTKEAGDTDGDGCVSMTDVNRLFNYVRGAASTLG